MSAAARLASLIRACKPIRDLVGACLLCVCARAPLKMMGELVDTGYGGGGESGGGGVGGESSMLSDDKLRAIKRKFDVGDGHINYGSFVRLMLDEPE